MPGHTCEGRIATPFFYVIPDQIAPPRGATLASIRPGGIRDKATEPARWVGQGEIIRVVIDRDGVWAAANVHRGRRDYVSPVAAHVYPTSKLADAIADKAARMAKNYVFAAAAGQKAPGCRERAVLLLQSRERLVAVMPPIDIDGEDAAGGARRDPDVVPYICEPAVDYGEIVARVLHALWRELAERMLGGVATFERIARADAAAVSLYREVQWEHG